MQDPIIAETEACGSLHDKRRACIGCYVLSRELNEDYLCPRCVRSNREEWRDE